MKRELTKCQLIERSIQKKYRKELWRPFTEAIKRYELIQEGDKIAVCISGGKDSMLMAKMLQLLHKISIFPFEAEYLVMDPGYNDANRKKIEENAALLEIPIKVFETDIFDVAYSTPKSPCYLCARMRRGHLYSMAQKMGCNKIALGHHFSDVIETTLMGMLYGAQIQAMRPKLHSVNFEGMELIRPLYCVHEDSIIAWRDYNGLEFLQCACKFTEKAAYIEGTSKRKETKELIKELKKTNPLVECNIFNSIHDVNVDTLIGYKANGELHSFVDEYRSDK
ncbi:tRNA-cytidine(32) 2-sulfurtransferase [Clostridiales bacterium]|nr:tRNA-cytidine(32) 2-sulfurtransferase [Clostridiales bacterium]